MIWMKWSFKPHYLERWSSNTFCLGHHLHLEQNQSQGTDTENLAWCYSIGMLIYICERILHFTSRKAKNCIKVLYFSFAVAAIKVTWLSLSSCFLSNMKRLQLGWPTILVCLGPKLYLGHRTCSTKMRKFCANLDQFVTLVGGLTGF